MSTLVQQLSEWDRFLLVEGQSLRWEPFTIIFVLASAWWVKWPLFLIVGACGDARCCRRRLPVAFLSGVTAVGIAAALTSVVKDLVERARPAFANPAIEALVATPGSPSFPSGHAATAFAAAVAVGAFYPRVRWLLLGLAALVGLSRIYLGVHYALDVVAGAALGIALGLAVVWLTRRFGGALERFGTSPQSA